MKSTQPAEPAETRRSQKQWLLILSQVLGLVFAYSVSYMFSNELAHVIGLHRDVLGMTLILGLFLGLICIAVAQAFLGTTHRVPSEVKIGEGTLESQLREAAFNAIPAHIAILDSNGMIIHVNARWPDFTREILNQESHLVVGVNYLDIIERRTCKSSSEFLLAATGIRKVIEGLETDFQMELPFRNDIEHRWFKLTVTIFQCCSNNYVVVAHEDITQRKVSENRLTNAQSKFRRIYERSSDAIMLSDKTGFFDCNEKTLQLFGVGNREEFLKLKFEDLTPRLQSDGSESIEKLAWHSTIAAADGESRFEWIYRRADGSVFPAEVVLSAFELDGRLVQQTTVRDITLRKQNESQLKDLNDRLQVDLEARQLAEASLKKATSYLDVYRLIVDEHAIVAETDVTGAIVYANDSFCEISGYSREELIGKNHRILNSEIHPKSMWQDMYKTVANGGVWRGEICNRSKSGRLYWVDTTIAPLFDEARKTRGYFALRADITALKNARKQAESSNLAKSEFLANMSHEIRTPMTAILGFADLLAEESDAKRFPKQFEYVDTIKRNGEHLLSIINDILDISKIEAEKMVVEQIDTDPIKIVNDVMTVMEVKAKAKGLTLIAEFVSAIPKTIQSDPTRVRQILDNLVGNAIKFTDRGGVKIEVGIDPAEPSQLMMLVIDSGIGIKPEQVGRLFGSFEQADASTTRRFGGSGLGLRISKTLAEMLGGSMTLETKYGNGSKFTARVKTNCKEGTPMIEFNRGRKAMSTAEPAKTESNTNILAGMRILLAEDGVDNRRLISFHLKKAGATVAFAENGKLAVESLTTDGTLDGPLLNPVPFDLIISDIQMPVMDGLTSIRLLREKGCKLPILALTAHAMSSDADKSKAAGCNAHLTKPIDQRLLITTCERWIKMFKQSQPDTSQLYTSEFADDPDMVELLDEYIASFEGTVSDIKSSLETRNYEQLGRLAHQLKGSGGGFGFPIISASASKVEAKVKSKANPTESELLAIQESVYELVSILELAQKSVSPTTA
ncbi:MAG: PAS domain S-box protein [Planctomycetota bacterium]|nr:PAS domain S-box protein [Planctomycetota bacterium]